MANEEEEGQQGISLAGYMAEDEGERPKATLYVTSECEEARVRRGKTSGGDRTEETQ